MTMTIESAEAAVDNLAAQLESIVSDLKQLRTSNCALLLEPHNRSCTDVCDELHLLRQSIINNKTQMAERLVEQAASVTALNNL